jgi:hypothetical protein
MFAPFPRPIHTRSGACSTSISATAIPYTLNPSTDSEDPADIRGPNMQSSRMKAPTTNSRQKESHFLDKYGQRHHSYDAEKAPYPLSYDRSVLELCVSHDGIDRHSRFKLSHREALAQRFLMDVMQTVSFVKFAEGPPKRSLDLGCGVN